MNCRLILCLLGLGLATAAAFTAEDLKPIVGPGDWNQFGGSPSRNNVSDASVPVWWDCERGINIKWSAPLGSQTYGTPVVANGKVFVGTNNGGGYLNRYPAKIDLGVLLCFDEQTGKFLWQHSNEKRPAGRVHDWPLQGVCSTPLAEGERLWYVTNRCEVVCLDAQGFHDGENDGPFKTEGVPATRDQQEADVVWKLDMIGQLGVHPHNMSSCSITGAGDRLFVTTSNGVDESHLTLPAPDAPSLICLEKGTGRVLWTDNSPGRGILHGQWSSPAYGVFQKQPQVLFAAGDGWLYSFDPVGANGKSKLLWKADLNPKDSQYTLQRSTRNPVVATPVIYDGLVYIGVGDDPEHGEGEGHLWCLNPVNKGGDVSATLVFNRRNPDQPIQGAVPANDGPAAVGRGPMAAEGNFERPNPNSAVVWHYTGRKPQTEDFLDFMHRTISTVAIKDGLVIAPDFCGAVHCLDAKTGKCHWTFDSLASIWSSPLIAGDRAYYTDEDGDCHILGVSTTFTEYGALADGKVETPRMPTAAYSTPVVANGVLFIADKLTLYAIAQGARSAPPKRRVIDSD